ncbi:MAG: hypothetical protein U1F43_18410 [Myxococcota bacterium]
MLAVLAAGASSALAAPPAPAPENPDDALEAAVPARLVMGMKFGGGGTLWDEPKNTTLGQTATGPFDLPIFDATRGGYTMSAGFFAQGIFFDHLGIEVGVHFVEHKLLEKIDWTYTEATTINGQTTIETQTAKSEEALQWTALHVPILVQAIVPAGKTRISLGVGPEFAFASWAKTKFDVTQTDAPDGRLPGSRAGFTTLGAKLQDAVYLTVNFGIQIDAGDFVIPIDIHWSYDFSQGSDYLDRADPIGDLPDAQHPDRVPTGLTLHTRDTMYGGIRIGIGYQF